MQTMTATGEYRMVAHDTPGDAERLALVAAKSQIHNVTADYLATVPVVQQLGLNQTEIRAYTVGLFEIDQYPARPAESESGTTLSVPVKIHLDPAVVARQLNGLMQNERAKTELMRIRDTLDAYFKELDDDRTRLAKTKEEADVKAILQHRRDVLTRIDTEEQFARTWTTLFSMREAAVPQSRATQDKHGQSKEPARAPGNAEEHRKKGALLADQGRFDEALVEFHEALRLIPDLDRAHLGLGAALQGKGDLDGAIAEYQTVLKQHPNDAHAHNNLGSALQMKGDAPGAIAEYRKALESEPNDAVTHFNLGTALATNGKVQEAVEAYRTATRLDPDLFQAYFDLGGLLRDNNQPREAVSAFREYLRRAPDTPANRPFIEQARAYLDTVREQRRERLRQGTGP